MTAISLNCWSESDQKAIREQLDRILKSGPFQQSQRRQRFLEYIVNETLAGRGERLKGYNVALEVFDRPETFDPAVDPLVRIEAARLRDKLREYYEADGRSDPIRIDLPKGSYTPQIEFRQAGRASPARLRTQLPANASAGDRRRRYCRWSERTMANRAAGLGADPGSSAPAGAWFARDHLAPAPKSRPRTESSACPEVPAIAVLPFVNLSGDPKQDYFSDGLTEDILTELSRARDLRVLARNTTFQYKGKAVDVAKLGRELEVRYVLEGSVQRSGDRLRVTAQLIDAETGTHIWADRFDREMADVFLVQDEIVSQIVAKIAGGYGVIESTEAKSAARKSPEQIQAYDLVSARARRDAVGLDRRNLSRGERALHQAIALDPVECAGAPRAGLARGASAGSSASTRRQCHRRRSLRRRPRPFSSTPPTHARGWWPHPPTSSPSSSICSSTKRSRRWRLPPMTPRSWPRSPA